LNNHKVLIGTRVFYPEKQTGLYIGDKNGIFKEIIIRLPSGKDNSFHGLILEKDRLLVSYFSRRLQISAPGRPK